MPGIWGVEERERWKGSAHMVYAAEVRFVPAAFVLADP